VVLWAYVLGLGVSKVKGRTREVKKALKALGAVKPQPTCMFVASISKGFNCFDGFFQRGYRTDKDSYIKDRDMRNGFVQSGVIGTRSLAWH
jgi:hypothetical protein